jgi:hypothetical protein
MDWLKSLAPTAATLLGGPMAGLAVKFLAGKLGVPDATAEAVTSAMAGLNETPEGRVKLAEVDAALRMHAVDAGVDLERLAVQNAADVNTTMQAESASEHWPSYSWRPAIGFAVAVNVVMTAITVASAYWMVIFWDKSPELLNYLPAMLGAMAALIGVVSPILGIASWFRGKAQADPNVLTSNKG